MIDVIYRLHNDNESARAYSKGWMKRKCVKHIVKNEQRESV